MFGQGTNDGFQGAAETGPLAQFHLDEHGRRAVAQDEV
jgi:hypothetical protein